MINPYGYIPDKRKPDNAVYGAIFPSAGERPFNWLPYLPPRERQLYVPFCVTFSRLNCGEGRARKDGLELNLSDRYLGVISGTTKSGNGMAQVSETFRKLGCVQESVCPWGDNMLALGTEDSNWQKIFDLSFVPENVRKYFGGNYSWVSLTNLAEQKDALGYSPLQLACPVYDNWESNEIVDASRVGSKIIGYHAITCYYIDDYYYIQDSIGREFKKLTLDYPLTGIFSFRDLPDNWKELNNMVKIDQNKLTQIYDELLFRTPDADAFGYIGQDEEFVRSEIMKSQERGKLQLLINRARDLAN